MSATLARRAAARPWAQNRRLLTAAIAVVLARLGLRLPFPRIVALLRLAPGQTPASETPETIAEAVAVGQAVRVAAGRLPGTFTCLAQAMAASALLRLRGIESTMILGVATDGTAPDGLAAHAWLRCATEVITGSEGHDRYVPIASYASTRRGRGA